MPFIKISSNYLMSLRKLSQLVLRYIYDNKSITHKEEDDMMRGMMCWNQNKFKSDSQELMLQKLGGILKKDSEGKLENRKKLFSDKNIDYKKFHRLNKHVW